MVAGALHGLRAETKSGRNAAAMYSLVSHIAVDGASVRRYSVKIAAPAIAAAK